MHVFSRAEFDKTMHVDIAPGYLRGLWGNARGTPFVTRVRQHSENAERVYKGTHQYSDVFHTLKDGDTYYQISTGYNGGLGSNIEFGVVRPAHVVNPDLYSDVADMPVTMIRHDPLKLLPAAKMYVSTRDRKTVSVSFATGLATQAYPHMLGLDSRAKTVTDARRVLRLFGEIAGNIVHGQPVDFTLIQQAMENTGMRTVGIAHGGLFKAPSHKIAA